MEKQLRDHQDELDEAEAQAVLDGETALDEEDYWNEFDELDTTAAASSDPIAPDPSSDTFSAQSHEAADKFNESIQSVRYVDCDICCEKFWTVKQDNTKCDRCQRSTAKGMKYSAENDMDPGASTAYSAFDDPSNDPFREGRA